MNSLLAGENADAMVAPALIEAVHVSLPSKILPCSCTWPSAVPIHFSVAARSLLATPKSAACRPLQYQLFAIPD